MASRTEQINDILQTLKNDMSDVVASVLVSVDGLVLASQLPPDISQDNIGGVVATLLQLTQRAANELRQGAMEQVIIQSEEGYSFILGASEGTFLVVLAKKGSTLGLLMANAKNAARDIAAIM